MSQSNALRVLFIPLLSATVIGVIPGCGGGDEVDFSKPTTGLPTLQTAQALPSDGQPAAQPTSQPAAASTAKPSLPPAKAGNDATVAKPKTNVNIRLGNRQANAAEDADKTAANAKELSALPPVTIVAGRSNRAFRHDEDEDDPTKWRTNKFELSPEDQRYLRYANRGAISETGELTAGIDESTGEILVFESRFGQVRALFQLSDASPVAIAVSQSNEQVIVLDSAHQVHVFDVPDLGLFDVFARRDFIRSQLAREPLTVTDASVTRMQISPSGEQLIIATVDGRIEIRALDSRPANGTAWPAQTVIEAHKGEILAITMTADEAQLATTAADGTVKLWDVESMECIAELPKVNVPAFALCAIENGIAIGRASGTVEAWLKPGEETREIREFYDQYNIAVTSLMVEPRKGLLVRGRVNGSTNLLDMTTGEIVLTRKPFQSPVSVMAPWPDHGRVLALGLDGRYTSWDVPLFREKQQFGDDDGSRAINKPVNWFYVARFAPARAQRNGDDDDDAALTHSDKQELALREFRDGLKDVAKAGTAALSELRKADEKHRQQHRDRLQAGAKPAQDAKKLDLLFQHSLDLDSFSPRGVRLALSESGETLVVATPPDPLQTGFIEAWDVPSGKLLRRWATDRTYETLRLVADGKWLIPIPVKDQKRRQESIGYYDLRTGLSVSSPGDPQCVAVSASGRVAIGFLGRYRESTTVAGVYDPADMKRVATLTMFETMIPAMCFIGEDELVLSVRERARARLVVSTTSGTISEKIILHEDKERVAPWINASGLVDNELPGVTDISLLSNSGDLATNGQYQNNDYRFAIWQRKGDRYPAEDINGAKKSSAFLREASQGACRMCAAKTGVIGVLTADGAVTVDVDDGKVLTELKLERTDSALLDREGRWLVIGDETGTIRVTSAGVLKPGSSEFRAHDGPVLTVASSEGGSYLASLGEEGYVKAWKLSDKLPARKRD